MANSVTARFNDDCKVFVSMSDDTTVEKAVIIDAEGNETDIGGGGGESDFSTVEVTIINNSGNSIDISGFVMLPEDDASPLGDIVYLTPATTKTVDAVLYKNRPSDGFLDNYSSELYSLSFSGDVEDDGDGYFKIKGSGTVTIADA